MKINKIIRIGITVILSTLFLYIAFRNIEWDKVLTAFASYNLWWLLPVTILVLFSIFIRALRLKLILKPVKDIKTHILFESIILSYFTNILLPINIGEIVRAYIIKKKTKISMFCVFGGIAIERLMSILGFLIVGIIAVFFIILPSGLEEIQGKIATGINVTTLVFLLFLIIIIVVKKYRIKIVKFLSQFTRKYTKSISGASNNFLTGLGFGATRTDQVLIILYSIFLRVLFGIITLCIALGFGIKLPLIVFLFIDVFISFAYTIGSSLGIIGTYEASLVYALAFFGVTKEIGLAIALIADVTFIIPSFFLGLIYFLREGLSFKRLRELNDKNKF